MSDDQKKTFAAWLGAAMAKRKLKRAQVAAALGVDHVSVNNWAAAKHLPEAVVVPRIAEFFEVEPDFLLELAGYRPAGPEHELKTLDPRLWAYMVRIARLSPHAQEMIADMVAPVVEYVENAK